MYLPCAPHRAAACLLRAAYEERVRGLEDAIGSRDRTLAQLRDGLLQADMEYKKVRPGFCLLCGGLLWAGLVGTARV